MADEGIVLGGIADDDPWALQNHGGVVRHIPGHHAVCADAHIVADGHIADDLGAGADEDVIPNGGMALAGILTRTAKRYALIKRAVVANFGGLTDNNARAVVYKQILAYGSAGVYLKK